MVNKKPEPPKLLCPECKYGNGCQMRPDFEKHFEKLKPCRFFDK
jgi:hypothetical protein